MPFCTRNRVQRSSGFPPSRFSSLSCLLSPSLSLFPSSPCSSLVSPLRFSVEHSPANHCLPPAFRSGCVFDVLRLLRSAHICILLADSLLYLHRRCDRLRACGRSKKQLQVIVCYNTSCFFNTARNASTSSSGNTFSPMGTSRLLMPWKSEPLEQKRLWR